MCIGSLGNPASTPDYIDNVLLEYITTIHCSNAACIKNYAGQSHIGNITFRNIHFLDVNQPISLSRCIYSYSICDRSRSKMSDVTWENNTGTSRYNAAAGICYSKQMPCTGFKFKNIDIKPKNGGAAKVLCTNMNSDSGLTCTGTCPAG